MAWFWKMARLRHACALKEGRLRESEIADMDKIQDFGQPVCDGPSKYTAKRAWPWKNLFILYTYCKWIHIFDCIIPYCHMLNGKLQFAFNSLAELPIGCFYFFFCHNFTKRISEKTLTHWWRCVCAFEMLHFTSSPGLDCWRISQEIHEASENFTLFSHYRALVLNLVGKMGWGIEIRNVWP